MTPEQLAALREELQTQDNATTADPLFVVFQEERIYGVSQNYQTNGFTWVGADDSSVTADDDEAKVLDKLLDEDRELSIGGVTFERVWCRIVPRFVTACLTRKGAEAFIARDGHNPVPILGAGRVQPLCAGTDRALPCRCRRGAVEVM